MDHDNLVNQDGVLAGPSGSAPTTPTSVKKPRSPVERAIVWGLILAGLVALMVEARSSFSLAADRDALLAAIDKSPSSVTESQAEKLITRYSQRESRSGLKANVLASTRVDTYMYGGLLKKRVLYIYYGLKRAGHEQDVIEVTETPIKFYSPEEFGIGPDGKLLPGNTKEDTNKADTKEAETKPIDNADSTDASTTDEKPEVANGEAQTTEEK